jgi:hypothetical protein
LIVWVLRILRSADARDDGGGGVVLRPEKWDWKEKATRQPNENERIIAVVANNSAFEQLKGYPDAHRGLSADSNRVTPACCRSTLGLCRAEIRSAHAWLVSYYTVNEAQPSRIDLQYPQGHAPRSRGIRASQGRSRGAEESRLNQSG